MNYEIRQCTATDLSELLSLEAEVIASLEDPAILRRNSEAMWRTCLAEPHLTLGAWFADHLVAIAVLYTPTDGDPDNLAALLQPPSSQPSANYKICLVAPAHRGQGLQRRLGLLLEDEARGRGVNLLCSTVSPLNVASLANLEALGYRRNRELQKYGSTRLLMAKHLYPTAENGKKSTL
ncbi:MAG: GNAT family N-acetyltransferase [Bacteroidales bacterium]|nr:GNAT family N-acetyltransferase [Bacteroidales bacterium]